MGDLGYSITAQTSVTSLIKAHDPYTLVLTVTSFSIAVTIGVTAGLVVGYYRGIVDTIIMRIVDVLLAFPRVPAGAADHRHAWTQPAQRYDCRWHRIVDRFRTIGAWVGPLDSRR